jgi:hypothetical protein
MTDAPAIAKQFNITGFPTVKYFQKNSFSYEDYNGVHTADNIIK